MNGADINARGEDGDTPLHRGVGAIGGGAAMVTFLLSRGADPDVKSDFGWSARDSALHSKDPEVVAAMQRFGSSK
jgi:ankyrin repeat protein